ncbi:MAG: RIP metalloprotease RseP [Bacteroidetes bacterium]|nr:RIP metalloprotease RseP [Bacteroidota bacterium]
MQLLAIEWGVVGVKAAQLILSLSILVILHEFGHYITARWFGCRVEKFYLFFDPWFSLFKKKVGDTEYGIGWLPLGGYVKISGMIDESMDTEAMKQPAQAWEFRSKPAWQRLIIMLGGIIMNVIVAIIVYSMVLFAWGSDSVPMSSLKNGIYFQDSIYAQIGFKNGDRVISVDDKKVDKLDDAALRILMGKSAVVDRQGENITLNFPENLIGTLIESKRKGASLLMPRIPAIVGSYDGLNEESPAKNAGLKEGDIIKHVNGIDITFYDEIKPSLQNAKDSVSLIIERNGVVMNVQSAITKDKRLVLPYITNLKKLDTMGVLSVEHKSYSFFGSIPAGVALSKQKLVDYIDQFKKMLQPKTGAYKGLGGFKAIANAFPAVWDWESFWNLTAFLSIVLAFMNLLPIPALDGGHVMFTLYEMITRRKPNEKFLEYAQMAGMLFLLLLMIYANGNDWFGWGK